jgi:hypothetical protein
VVLRELGRPANRRVLVEADSGAMHAARARSFGRIAMHRYRRVTSTLASVALPFLTGCALALQLSTATAQTSDNVIYLNQAWSPDDREWYYHFSQGSAVLSSDIFLNLEVADGQDLFRSNANLARYGMIPTSG